MFRGSLLVVTIAVFGGGVGLGYAWTRGYVPFAIVPANSGSISPEVIEQEPLPPPNDDSSKASTHEAYTADPAIFEQQSEPNSDRIDDDADQPDVRNRKPKKIASTEDVDWSDSTERPETPGKVPSQSRQSNKDLRSRLATSNDATGARSNSERSNVERSNKSRPRAQIALELETDDEPPRRDIGKKSVKVVAHQDPSEDEGDQRSTEQQKKELTPSEQLAAAKEKLAAGETLPAHRDMSDLYWHHKDLRPEIETILQDTAKKIFFQAQPHFMDAYVVQPGDRLEEIAKKYHLSWQYLAKLNRTEPKRIQIDQKLKVMNGPFGAVVELREFALTVHLQGYFVRRYSVGIGKDGSSPIGKFLVLNKVENPQYTGPDGKVIASKDPDNPLGKRWIDLGDSYGIHGTIDPSSIGKAESRGCIRLKDRDIIEVYDFLTKGSEVVIRK